MWSSVGRWMLWSHTIRLGWNDSVLYSESVLYYTAPQAPCVVIIGGLKPSLGVLWRSLGVFNP